MDDAADLFGQQIPRLRRYARALTGDRLAADDLVQDTLERAWSRRDLWRAGSDLRAWLFTIMHNLFVNRVRGGHLETVPLDDDALAASTPGTQEHALCVRDLEAGLARLPAEQRAVLLLVGLEGMGYEEVAAVLGMPTGTVMSRLARGRERLRILLAGTSPRLRRVK